MVPLDRSCFRASLEFRQSSSSLKTILLHKQHRAMRLLCHRFAVVYISGMCLQTLQISVTLREEPRLRMFENRMLKRIFGPKRDVITGEWRRLHNEELNDLYSSPNINRTIK